MTSKYLNILPMAAVAALFAPQTAAAAGEPADSLNLDDQVQLAFRTIDKEDMLGGAEVLDI